MANINGKLMLEVEQQNPLWGFRSTDLQSLLNLIDHFGIYLFLYFPCLTCYEHCILKQLKNGSQTGNNT